MLELQVVTDLEGNFVVQIGSTGVEGLLDGTFDDATFNRPQVRNKYYFFWLRETIIELEIDLPCFQSIDMGH